MKFRYEKQLRAIANCPAKNEAGEITLFRCIENPLTNNSFLPQAVLRKPKFQDMCEAWGLSTFNDLSQAHSMLKSLARSKRIQYSGIAKLIVTDEDGIKYQSFGRKAHYTFFPKEDMNFIDSVEIVYENE